MVVLLHDELADGVDLFAGDADEVGALGVAREVDGEVSALHFPLSVHAAVHVHDGDRGLAVDAGEGDGGGGGVREEGDAGAVHVVDESIKYVCIYKNVIITLFL